MRAALSVALALLVAACSDSTGLARDLRVQTDKSVYGLGPGNPTPQATVRFTVKNTGSTAVALANCGATVSGELQQLQGGLWVTVASTFCPAYAVYALIVLQPGESAEGQTTVSASGRYRVRVMVPPAGDEEPVRYAASSTFEARWLED